MTKFLTHTALALTLLTSASLATTASANPAQEKPFYINFSYGQSVLDGSGVINDLDTDAFALTFGYQPHPYLAAEATYTYHDFDASSAIEGHVGEIVLVATPFKYRVRPIAMLGVMYYSIEIKAGNIDEQIDEVDVVFGGGVDFDITDHISVRAIYKATGNSIDTSGWFIGPTIRF